MSKFVSILMAAAFAAVTITPVAFAAEKKEMAKVDCKDAKHKDHKDCMKKK
jgi:Ni/Co efflux regulator RcnB